MADASDQTVIRHANWVGLRTLRQRPKVVDHTPKGEPIFEIRSVRLLLRADADHFNRLAQCSKCGRNVPGPPVLALGDLDRPANSVICKECVRDATASPSRPAPRPAAPVARAAPMAKAGEVVRRATPELVDDDRLGRVESQLQAAMTRLEALADAQGSESGERRRDVETAQSTIQAAMAGQLAGLRAELTAAVDGTAERVGALEDNLRRSIAGVAEALSAQRDQVAAISGAIAQTREELRAVLAKSQPAAAAIDPGWAEAVERRIKEALRTELQAGAAETAGQAKTDVTALREQLQGNALALTRMVEVQRADLEGALEDRLGAELTTMHQSVAELAKGHVELEGRVDGVAQHAWQAEAQVGGLAAAVDASASRLEVLEQQLNDSVHRLTQLVEVQRRESRVARAKPAGAGEATRMHGGAGGDLLDDLDRQLHDAETRLAQMAGPQQRS